MWCFQLEFCAKLQMSHTSCCWVEQPFRNRLFCYFGNRNEGNGFATSSWAFSRQRCSVAKCLLSVLSDEDHVIGSNPPQQTWLWPRGTRSESCTDSFVLRLGWINTVCGWIKRGRLIITCCQACSEVLSVCESLHVDVVPACERKAEPLYFLLLNTSGCCLLSARYSPAAGRPSVCVCVCAHAWLYTQLWCEVRLERAFLQRVSSQLSKGTRVHSCPADRWTGPQAHLANGLFVLGGNRVTCRWDGCSGVEERLWN